MLLWQTLATIQQATDGLSDWHAAILASHCCSCCFGKCYATIQQATDGSVDLHAAAAAAADVASAKPFAWIQVAQMRQLITFGMTCTLLRVFAAAVPATRP